MEILFSLLCDKKDNFFIYCAGLSVWNALVRKVVVVMTVLIYDQASINVLSMNTYLDCTLQKILLSMKIKGTLKYSSELSTPGCPLPAYTCRGFASSGGTGQHR